MVARAGSRPAEAPPSARWPGGGPQREPRETDCSVRRVSSHPLLFRPRNVCGCRQKSLHAGEQGQRWEWGPAKTCLSMVEFGVWHLCFLAWPSARIPTARWEGAACRGND